MRLLTGDSSLLYSVTSRELTFDVEDFFEIVFFLLNRGFFSMGSLSSSSLKVFGNLKDVCLTISEPFLL